MPHIRNRVLAVCAASLLVGAGAGAAQASGTTAKAAVKVQDRTIQSSAAYKSLKHIKINTPAQARKLIAEFKVLQRRIDHAATVVAAASSSDAKQKQGQRDWVRGVRDLGRGIGQLDRGLQLVIHNKEAAGKRELAKADKTVAAATRIGTRGDKLLGLPHGA
jgi:hypothetical protein